MNTNFNNGLDSFSFHEASGNNEVVNQINSSFKQKSLNMATGTISQPEDVAKFYLEKAMNNQQEPLANFNMPGTSIGSKIDFKPFQTEDLPFTENKTVKFRQTVNDIAVYGSCINVEMDKEFNLVSINSSMVPNIAVNTIAKISAEDAIKKAGDYIYNDIPPSTIPLLYLYFFESNWKLVYLIKNVVSKRKEDAEQHNIHNHGFMNYVNIIIDAETGEVLKESPRAMSLIGNGKGDDGENYDFSCRDNEGLLELVDDENNVITYDLNFKSFSITGNLPGSIITKNGSDWLPAGINAHCNACTVAKFLKDVLKRNGVDNKGMSLVSTVRCVEDAGQNVWNNAAWIPGIKQMVYGQAIVAGQLKSLAVALDVVAHEILHGVTEFTSNLDYENQSGALNESYSDIFGTIISNYSNPIPGNWSWQLGETISGVPFRDLSNPPKYNQPEHMDQYQDLPNNRWNDWGGVHINSGIHNKAAYNLITSKSANGDYIFSIKDSAVLFYLGLLQLSNSSGFKDSYRSILNSANSFFKNDPDKMQKIVAVENAFMGVGIN